MCHHDRKLTADSPALTVRLEHFINADPAQDDAGLYNYLLYTFNTAQGEVLGRCYLSDMSEVCVIPTGATEQRLPVPQAVLDYLHIRYTTVKMLTHAGYVTMKPRAQHDQMPPPSARAEAVILQ